MSPSVATDEGGELFTILRSVNYSIVDGRYQIRHPDDRVRTRNLLGRVDPKLHVTDVEEIADRVPREEHDEPRIQGFEDCRLFRWRDRWWAVATTLEFNRDERFSNGRPEVCLLGLERAAEGFAATRADLLRGHESDRCQKNWLPFVKDGELHLLYASDPTIVLRFDPETTCEEILRDEPCWDLSNLRGSSQLVPAWSGWLYVAHEAFDQDDERRYTHRLVWMDEDLRIRKISDPFYFHHKGIEFCAGLA